MNHAVTMAMALVWNERTAPSKLYIIICLTDLIHDYGLLLINRYPWMRLIIAGQTLSLILTGTGTFSQLLSDRGVNISTAQSLANYLLLSLFAVHLSLSKHEHASTLTNVYHVIDSSNSSRWTIACAMVEIFIVSSC
jgi:hypothetical protein